VEVRGDLVGMAPNPGAEGRRESGGSCNTS
jgi:hypothetical protein